MVLRRENEVSLWHPEAPLLPRKVEWGQLSVRFGASLTSIDAQQRPSLNLVIAVYGIGSVFD